jgi:hypothetical protein
MQIDWKGLSGAHVSVFCRTCKSVAGCADPDQVVIKIHGNGDIDVDTSEYVCECNEDMENDHVVTFEPKEA